MFYSFQYTVFSFQFNAMHIHKQFFQLLLKVSICGGVSGLLGPPIFRCAVGKGLRHVIMKIDILYSRFGTHVSFRRTETGTYYDEARDIRQSFFV